MIAGLIIATRAWRRVALWRLASAVVLVVSAEMLVGAAAAALLGFKAGKVEK